MNKANQTTDAKNPDSMAIDGSTTRDYAAAKIMGSQDGRKKGEKEDGK